MKTVFENIKGVIFDYGGTIDTNSVHWAEVLWAAYVKMGISFKHFGALFGDTVLGNNVTL